MVSPNYKGVDNIDVKESLLSPGDNESDEIFFKKDSYQNSESYHPEIKVGCRRNFTDCSNVFKAFIGSAIIGLPFAVSQAGIGLTIIGIIVIAVITDHCCDMIVKCKRIVIENIRKDRETQGVDAESIDEEMTVLGRTLSFGRIGKFCLGRPGLLAVNISVMVTQFGFTIGYFIFMGNTLRSILKFWLVPDTAFSNMTLPINTTFTPIPTNTTPLMTTTMPTTTTSNVSILLNRALHPTFDFGTVNSSTILHFLHHHISRLKEAAPNPWSASNLLENSTITFGVLILFPLPLLIGFAFVRNLRKLGPVSVVANMSITGAAFTTAVYMLVQIKHVPKDIIWFKFSTFPIFFGQVTSAFEGIGTVIPIEGSMAENRPKYPVFLHVSMMIMCVLLTSFGITGYLRFGNMTCQIVTQNLRGEVGIVLQIMLFIGVMFTYPLQIYPNIQIVEHLFVKLRRWSVSRQRRYEVMKRAAEEESLIDSVEEKPPEIKSVKLKKWEGNIIRMVLVCFTAACALLFRSQFAYIAALTGSVGSSLLSYILPPAFDVALRRRTISRVGRIKNYSLIVFGVVLGVMGVYVTLHEIVESFKKGHSIHC